jgi:hypothetical protein
MLQLQRSGVAGVRGTVLFSAFDRSRKQGDSSSQLSSISTADAR